MIHKNTRQIFPFSIFGLGSFINKIFEFLFSLLNIGIKTYTLFRFENSPKKEMSKSILVELTFCVSIIVILKLVGVIL